MFRHGGGGGQGREGGGVRGVEVPRREEGGGRGSGLLYKGHVADDTASFSTACLTGHHQLRSHVC